MNSCLYGNWITSFECYFIDVLRVLMAKNVVKHWTWLVEMIEILGRVLKITEFVSM